MELLQKVHAHNIVKWAADKPEVLVFSADLTSSSEADLFRDTYPDRFFSFGMTEQHMMSFAGGMAREGYTPWVHTFAVFMYRRAYDQVAMSIAYPNAKVRMVGFLPGILTPGGATHQAIEDISVMRSLPNMTILETGDATEVESVLDVAQAVDGPVYIRMLRGEIPRLFPADEPFVFNRARVLRSGDGDGLASDIALLTTGICTEEALRVTHLLADQGVSIAHLHVSTLKPFTDPTVLQAVQGARRGVITLENHSVVGGLGTAVAEVMAEHGASTRLHRLGLQDTFAHGASRPYLMQQFGLDAMALTRKAESVLGTSFNIAEDDLKAVRLTAAHSEAKAEAL